MPMNQVAPARAQSGQPRPAAGPGRAGGEGGVRIGPFRPDPSLAPARYADQDAEHARANEAARASTPTHFIPPAAERPDEMQARMPRVEDFPAVAQRQIRASHAPAHGNEEDRRPRGLLARLTSGLSRRDEDYDESPRSAHNGRSGMDSEPRVVAASASLPPASAASDFARQAQPRRVGEASPAQGGLDPRGRPAPISQNHDDQLEIPAFLRRQTS